MKLEDGGSRVSNPGVVLNNGDGAGWIRPTRDNRVDVSGILPARKRPADDPRATPLAFADSTETYSVDSFDHPELVRYWRDEGTECDGRYCPPRPLTGVKDSHKHYAREWVRGDPEITILAEDWSFDSENGGEKVFVGMFVCWTSDLPKVSPSTVTREHAVRTVERSESPAVRFYFPVVPVAPAGNMEEDIDVLWREWRDREHERTRAANIARAKARTNAAARKLANSRLFLPAGVRYVKR